jgi:hypothetical protein
MVPAWRRNIVTDRALPSRSYRRKAFTTLKNPRHSRIEVIMVTRENNRIVETPTEARQAEPGPSVLSLLAISTGLAVLILGVIWFVFFRS